jgi:phosphatidylglycerophosphatase A
VWLATVGPAGFAPIAPGTFGSAAALVLFLPLRWPGPVFYVLSLAGICVLGVWAADRAERHFGREDDGRIVIDEVAGQLLTLLPLAIWPGDGSSVRDLLLLVTAFVVFRVLDIWKPGPVRWAESRFEGGLGVMADDILAGAIGAAILAVVVLAGAPASAPGLAS